VRPDHWTQSPHSLPWLRHRNTRYSVRSCRFGCPQSAMAANPSPASTPAGSIGGLADLRGSILRYTAGLLSAGASFRAVFGGGLDSDYLHRAHSALTRSREPAIAARQREANRRPLRPLDHHVRNRPVPWRHGRGSRKTQHSACSDLLAVVQTLALLFMLAILPISSGGWRDGQTSLP
jgi:hypothetical protein